MEGGSVSCPLLMSKYIQLTKGLSVLVDDTDYEKYNQFNWTPHYNGQKYYPVRKVKIDGKSRELYLHREIMEAPKGMFVDHINGDSLDCRKENMRIVTRSQNAMNRRIRSDNKTGVVGVSQTRSGKYMACYSIKGKLKRIGLFSTLEKAKAAREAAEAKYYGEYARSKDLLVEKLPEPKPENKPYQLYRKRVNNSSGKTGVSYFRPMKAWRARIRLQSKEKTLGYYKTFEEACAAREKAERQYFPQYFKQT
jgi:hypothetical protein